MIWQHEGNYAATPCMPYCRSGALHKCMDYPTKLLATQDLIVDMLIAMAGGFTLRIYWIVMYLQSNTAMLLLHVVSAYSVTCTGWSVIHRSWCNGHVDVTMCQTIARSCQQEHELCKMQRGSAKSEEGCRTRTPQPKSSDTRPAGSESAVEAESQSHSCLDRMSW